MRDASAWFLLSTALSLLSRNHRRSSDGIEVVLDPFAVDLAELEDGVKLPDALMLVPQLPDALMEQLEVLEDPKSILRERRQTTPSCQSVSYANTSPLVILSGSGSYLSAYEKNEKNGNAARVKVKTFLDTRNNVCSCGHTNANIVNKIKKQLDLINTNTRYLSPIHNELKSRLVSLLPPLPGDDTWLVVLTNSGSEANDLALRISSSCTKGAVLMHDMNYHGHTSALIDVSPYKLRSVGKNKPRKGTVWLERPQAFRCPGMSVPPSYYEKQFDAAMEALDGHNPPTLFYEMGMSCVSLADRF